ncbi:HAMP domain-containing histidine kinase [Mucilaginibacter sp. SMC90]|uniref:sensor histidine kinase n=1 Tax=Mucilaginibacter sp. SMC90 TaxID=2929803 RepID=UPI001FB2F5FC|nr:HAMP domain-containing sensor histidine kinase [Mucilaginibacter sp. SMC90]UOE49827.1 HAMP domain-containing histidine kinase [Mucilaginibacter sp. SMC90]
MKLLTKTSRILLGYAIVVLLVSIPLFYFVIEQLYYQDIDDALRLRKEELIIRTKKLQSERDIALWLAMDNDVKIGASAPPLRDSIYPKLYLDTLAHEMEPYRELATSLQVNHRRYRATIRRSLVESQDLIVGIAEVQGILLIILFIGWLLINRNISKKIWSPFDQIIDWLQNYEVDKEQTLIYTDSGVMEFDQLNRVVNELVNKNQKTYSDQKNFIENASHEMQTPVAILQSKLDLLLQSQGLTREQAHHLQSSYEVIERLTHLNQSLLLLSRIENQQFPDLVEVSIKTAVAKILDHLQALIDDKPISLSVYLNADRMLQGHPVLIEILLSNLITNAVHHTPAKGHIHIAITDHCFLIEKSGTPLSFDHSQLFSRFGKKNTNRQGVGLGLAIAHEISQLYQLKLHYQFREQKHQFAIVF